MSETTIKATISLSLKPWAAPSFAVRAEAVGPDKLSIPVRDLDDDTLEAMALAWVRDLYRTAGRKNCPFREFPKSATPQ